MSTLKTISLIIMASFYIFAGVSHFRKPRFFLAITPKWVPFPERINLLVGVVEITLGLLLLWNTTRSFAAWGFIIVLILVFPANIYHFQKAVQKKKGVLLTFIRLPLQLLLIYWAYSFV
jgi:uncharacterized membrane protein